MSGSIITQKKIADAFKQVLYQSDLESITVSQLMKQAKMRRQTFYDYFLDKYDLVNWIFQQELTEIINDNIGYRNWKDILGLLVEYFESNCHFYLKVLSYDGQNAFKFFLKEEIDQLLQSLLISAYKSKDKNIVFKSHENGLYCRILTNGLVETVTEWILSECPIDSRDLSRYFIDYLNHFISS
ncbi:HTH-type dhaKLM operon transcriptional activator dhaS [Alloiococcus otitis]|uniref:HTH tetR-type domain-containing protein n=1 Tax=Alloiococcus otitis ATCC 51267 TaxID=883081 RepID=K9EAV3_9LACT|nr:dihydroxyacetone kinase transcriptional activator DhaS [Alloiococcus otitis]EKU94354.1 hypothetical protein HMPREF9698_00082 [Alloiococcus otitis ATCC 51267]SUU81316.1 HTH-type dhaKLM operon transcriptional activator dhaS [Alloiococcus otitis]